jgi:hypothetical protein
MLWMIRLFLPHWFPFTDSSPVRSKVLVRQAIKSKSLPVFRAFYEGRPLATIDVHDKYHRPNLEQLGVIAELAKRYGVPWSSSAYHAQRSTSYDQALQNGFNDLIRDAPKVTGLWSLQKLQTRRALFWPEGKLHEEALATRAAVRKWNAAHNVHPLSHAPPHGMTLRFNDPASKRYAIDADVSAFARMIDFNDLVWHLPVTVLDAYLDRSCVLSRKTATDSILIPDDLLRLHRSDKQDLLSLAVRSQAYDRKPTISQPTSSIGALRQISMQYIT